ncbi:hypothetical protein BS50DRAFT_594786 [Corynespora cassiicola Philippines]|uniref:Mid2 domain-containing protein n=1 Tax=Corynespora cassiicola Philippines TaxID=1448308 RepID=A0A2T2N0Y0_CORCC|nr:hypothetical protein BS50DRAFT_594922 [Corynespora cassiicola Philippines]PSN59296.1 hypothetical protein BS50DRAFT_594786 [Corynespora cassiicola Philippines]
MTRSLALAASVLFFSRGIQAAYDEFFFASEASDWKCPTMGFDCVAPQVCAHESLLDKYYCCGTGSSNAVCWSGSSECGGSNDSPATGRIGCSEGDNAFCCLSEREECTQRFNQINICWATLSNPLTNFSETLVNETFSSLSSASPSATSWTFDLDSLSSTTSSTPASTAASTSASVSSSTAATSEPASSSTTPTSGGSPLPDAPGSDNTGLSGGAIGGIVVGVVGGIAILGAGAFFLWRRSRNNTAGGPKGAGSELDANPYAYGPSVGGYGAVAQEAPAQEKYAHEVAGEAPGHGRAPVEMEAHGDGPVEMEGSKPQGVVGYR